MNPIPMILVAVCAGGALIPARAADGTPGFYEKKAEGWFWYAPEAEAPPPEEETPEREAPLGEGAPSTPAPFSAAWLRRYLPRYLDLAWDEPSVENLRAFLYLQRFAIDRAGRFSDAAERAVVGDPFLDEIGRRPSAGFASWQVDRAAAGARERLLGDLARRVGLFFFFRSGGRYSALQAPLLELLEREEGFSVVAVSMDGKALANGSFPGFRIDRGQAARLGARTFPAVFLASPDGRFAAVGQGVMSLPELKHRILVAAVREGWISAARFEGARPLLDSGANLAERLDGSGLRALERNGGATGFVAPRRLMRYIRSRLDTDQSAGRSE